MIRTIGQLSFFDGREQFKFTKPVRLIELFAGYGSQHLALKYLGANFKSWCICEWAVKSIQAYYDLHVTGFTWMEVEKPDDEVMNELINYGISADYNEPMTHEQIKRIGSSKRWEIWNNIKQTANLVNIQNVHAGDLDIVDTDKYDYVMTYSFPCQDLSKAGKGAGMAKGSGTRSGMLWEVERILIECEQNNTLPKVLLMENVPDVIGSKNIEHFAYWVNRLEKMGYKCYWQVLNAKDYGIPQNRERCFMVSILGDYFYEFPKPIKQTKRLKDLLESEVEEKYYLSDKLLKTYERYNTICENKNNGFKFEPILDTDCVAKTITTRAGSRPTDNYILQRPHGYNKGSLQEICPTITTAAFQENNFLLEPSVIEITNGLRQAERVYDSNGIARTLIASGGGLGAKTGLYLVNNGDKNMGRVENHKGVAPTLDTRCDCLGVVRNYRIRKLTPRECFRLMGVRDLDYDRIAENQSNTSLYHLAGDSIVIPVLVAIFGQMVDGFNFDQYINEFYKQMGVL